MTTAFTLGLLGFSLIVFVWGFILGWTVSRSVPANAFLRSFVAGPPHAGESTRPHQPEVDAGRNLPAVGARTPSSASDVDVPDAGEGARAPTPVGEAGAVSKPPSERPASASHPPQPYHARSRRI